MGAWGEDRFPGEAGAAGGVARADKSPPSSAQSPLLARATSLRQQQERSSSAAQSKLCPRTGSRKTRAFQRNKGHFAAGQAPLPRCPPRAEPSAAVLGCVPEQGAAELRQPGVRIFHVPDSPIAPESLSYGPTSRPLTQGTGSQDRGELKSVKSPELPNTFLTSILPHTKASEYPKIYSWTNAHQEQTRVTGQAGVKQNLVAAAGCYNLANSHFSLREAVTSTEVTDTGTMCRPNPPVQHMTLSGKEKGWKPGLTRPK